MGDSMSRYQIQLFTEAKRLLQLAAEQEDLTQEARESYSKGINGLEAEIKQPSVLSQQDASGILPSDGLQSDLFSFVTNHNLWLSPYGYIDWDVTRHAGDTLYIEGIPAKTKNATELMRYVSFLNEIKNEYVLGRYFLFQAQYPSPMIDAVSKGVEFYKTYDYAIYDSYVQLLKSSLKQAVAVLDKIAYFLYDYCKISTPAQDKITFLSIWGDLSNKKLRKEFRKFENRHLFALFTLAVDLYSRGDWNSIIYHRNVVTHRFLILHNEPVDDQPNSDIPRKQLEDFRENTIHALQIAQVATMYLVLFVHHQTLEFAHENPTGHISAITPISRLD